MKFALQDGNLQYNLPKMKFTLKAKPSATFYFYLFTYQEGGITNYVGN